MGGEQKQSTQNAARLSMDGACRKRTPGGHGTTEFKVVIVSDQDRYDRLSWNLQFTQSITQRTTTRETIPNAGPTRCRATPALCTLTWEEVSRRAGKERV